MKKRLFIDALWDTGGRLNEILPLTREDFALNDPLTNAPLSSPFMVLRTLKQRKLEEAARPSNEGGAASFVKKHGIRRRSGWAHFSATTSASMNTLPTLRLSRRVWPFNRY
ncbi:hypothetical protein [Pantoea dispersa]|uniref:hypothetical protein n=1 Tax=Pantoea dispersa TaxID=59814 RepID=UPI001F0CB9CA|nr:hypothetical protein [Pantoea dispersa]